ncbi:hypothetical protein KIW84_063875 [Lathyrus oleraceus]|uniref:Uncharacterized protein n=1 Tax=Pisum sativum TaxID=3888 RepID=A0A9D4WA27_PEA|nr:hypothetical protein KIW84_063875 [Pisum sativum]
MKKWHTGRTDSSGGKHAFTFFNIDLPLMDLIPNWKNLSNFTTIHSSNGCSYLSFGTYKFGWPLRPCDNQSRNQKTELKPRRQVKLDSKQLTNQCNATANISDISPHLCFTCLLHSANENGLRLQDHPVDVYSLNRKRKSKSLGEESSGSAIPITKVTKTYGLDILRDTMRPEAKFVCSKTARSYEVTPFRNHCKSPLTETHFNFASFVLSTSSIPPEISPPSYIAFGTITTPPPRSSSVSETITIPRPSISFTLPIRNLTFSKSTTIIIISPPTLNTCTTFETTLTTSKPFNTKSHHYDSDFSTPTSITLTVPEAHTFTKSTPSTPNSPHQPLIDEHVIDVLME